MLEAITLDVGTDDERVFIPTHFFSEETNGGRINRVYDSKALLRADLISSMSYHAGFMGSHDLEDITQYTGFGVPASDQRRMTPISAGVGERAIFKSIVDKYLKVIYDEVNSNDLKPSKRIDDYAVNLLANDFYPYYGESIRRERDNN